MYRDPTSGVFVVSTYELVREAHKNDAVFSNEFTLALGSAAALDADIKAAMAKTYNLGKGTLLTVDDPEHKIYRDTVRDFFLAKNVETLPALGQRTGRAAGERNSARAAVQLYREVFPSPAAVHDHACAGHTA